MHGVTRQQKASLNAEMVPEEASHSSNFFASYLAVRNLFLGKKPSKGPQKPSNALVRCLFQDSELASADKRFGDNKRKKGRTYGAMEAQTLKYLDPDSEIEEETRKINKEPRNLHMISR